MRKINIKKIANKIKKYAPQKVILFGSLARGEEDEFSDLDLVIVKDTDKRFLDRLKEVIELLKPTFPFDILVYTPREFMEMKKKGNPFISMVLKEGKVIYESK